MVTAIAHNETKDSTNNNNEGTNNNTNNKTKDNTNNSSGTPTNRYAEQTTPASPPYYLNPHRLYPEIDRKNAEETIERLKRTYKEAADNFKRQPNETDVRIMNLTDNELRRLEVMQNEVTDSGCTADGPTDTDGCTPDTVRSTEHNRVITYTVMGYSTQHTQMSPADITAGRLREISTMMMAHNFHERCNRVVIDAHNYSVSGFLNAYAGAVNRHGHEAFEANRPITENLTAINSGPILAAMNTVTNYVGQDIITASNLNRMVPAMMSYDNTRAREEEKEEEGKLGGGDGSA